ncbi:MAG: hypothetical protein A2365_02630 [Candidatus Nealsonbacteria bacterium RIFOXYB1_FULL_40_15]|uniref:DUF1189 domain-containing protein n=2 Tax=Candidatus Nealsoniibacteriota TaxID=1817911 RepID=A0A1G2EP19_9BACT|nr:MAG: hypothetical protein A2365_02630 [Candidatus Nealsonbacteria bacterium RIFOXYB1_FULL_40_15]OGZ27497.1 MAG: hypothetical protein A2427_01485 [Candidatus Nealsonbacteria bacterium RIFOXYC1_FULL_40_7]OGZ28152.1 MAG: hypothetical protein A2562_02890 [Candidatus Nealsonbacteria bacterium RIFOXYD1_FULL_39_11]
MKIIKSIYGPDYYREVLTKPFSYSLKYFALFSLLISVLLTAFYSITYIPKAASFLEKAGSGIQDYYPEELEIRIEDGQASSNVKEPYFLKTPSQWKGGQEIKNLLVIDTESEFSIAKFYEYGTFCLLSKNQLACLNDNGAVEITHLREFGNLTVNKQVVNSFLDKFGSLTKFVYPAMVVGLFIGMFFLTFAVKVVYLLIGAFLVWLASWINKANAGYKKSYQLGFHLMTFPIIIASLIRVISHFTYMPHIPFLFSILLFIFALANIRKLTPAIS